MSAPPARPAPELRRSRRALLRRAALQGLASSALVAAPMLLAGCSLNPEQDHDGADAPDSGPLAKAARVAWVLSSGGPRGFVHVGVLSALDELGLAPDLLVGASVGALVAALYAGGHRGAALQALALDLQPWALADLAMSGSARFSGAPLAQWLRVRLPSPPLLQRLPLPVVSVAQRLDQRSAVAFTHGDAGLAVQAATAIEGRLTPVRIRGTLYADADQVMPLPVRLARSLGAQRVLAVDASAHEDRAPPGAQAYRQSDLRKRALTQPDADAADLVLHPDIGYWASLSRAYRAQLMRAGYEATLAAAPALRALHA